MTQGFSDGGQLRSLPWDRKPKSFSLLREPLRATVYLRQESCVHSSVGPGWPLRPWTLEPSRELPGCFRPPAVPGSGPRGNTLGLTFSQDHARDLASCSPLCSACVELGLRGEVRTRQHARYQLEPRLRPWERKSTAKRPTQS